MKNVLLVNRVLEINGLIIILDRPIDKSIQESITSLSLKNGGSTYLLDGEEATAELEEIIQNDLTVNPRESIFLFPGHSSQEVKKRLKGNSVCKRDIFAKRIWVPGENPVVVTSGLIHNLFIDWSITKVVVIDDVISSGQTMKKVRERNSWRFPNAKWYGATWLSRRDKIVGYEAILASTIIKENRLSPINSLSTLLENNEIASSYGKRNFDQPNKFLAILKEINFINIV